MLPRLFFSLFFVLRLIFPIQPNFLPLAEEPAVHLTTPKSGEVLQGRVPVTGNTRIEGFVSYEIAFSYQRAADAKPASDSWFLITSGKEAVEEGSLAIWDTTTIADGNYRLRLRVFLSDGKTVDAVVQSLRVRNYSAVETQTPAPKPAVNTTPGASTAVAGQNIAAPTPTSALKVLPLVELPPNPAEISREQIAQAIRLGAGGVALLLILLGVYSATRRWMRRI